MVAPGSQRLPDLLRVPRRARGGAVVAVQVLEHLERAYADTAVARFAAELCGEIRVDRGELEALMARLRIGQSLPRKATAWLAEKMTELKLLTFNPRPL